MRKKLKIKLDLLLKYHKHFAIGVAAVVFIALVYLVGFYQRPLQFSYSGRNCTSDITILPNLYSSKNDGNYKLGYSGIHKLRGYPIFATQDCLTAVSSPKEGSIHDAHLALANVPVPLKRYRVKTKTFPHVNTSALKEKISVREPLVLMLDQPDSTFNYRMTGQNKEVSCKTNNTSVSCDIAGLGLEQGKPYSLVVQRFFGNIKEADISTNMVTTADPVVITETTPAANITVFDKPTTITLKTNKVLVSAASDLTATGSDNKKVSVAHTTTVKDHDVTVTLTQPLPRNASIDLALTDTKSNDKGVLLAPYHLVFKSSGGPRVVGVNIGHTSVDPAATIIITFDQALAPDTDPAKVASLVAGNSALAVNASLRGRQIYLTPVAAFGACMSFSVQTTGAATNEFGIGGDSAWKYQSYARCYTTSVIGYSSQGRAIVAYRFGTGASKIVYVGTTHGDEKSTKYLLDAWIQELDTNPSKIPADQSIFVIPDLNPDGFAANTRQNGRGVDLNRNFPANDWKKDVTMPQGNLVVDGGGTAPLSEPESQALVNFILAQAPRLVLTFHSVASIVSGNATGNSDSLAIKYAGLARYRYVAFGEEDSVFHYDITGSFETWTRDKAGVPTLLVELGSNTASDFARNRAALWAML